MIRKLRIEEVALTVGVSVKTINNWYMFKKEHPNDPYAKMLPNFIQEGERTTRYWKQTDVWKLMKFKESIPKGRNGIMGATTQKYYHKTKKSKRNKIPE